MNMSVTLVPGLGRNLLSSSVALANGVETAISAFPALREKGDKFPLRADHNLYFMDNPTGTAERIRQCWRNVQRNGASLLRPYRRSKR